VTDLADHAATACLVEFAYHRDPRVRLSAVVALGHLPREFEEIHVAHARSRNWSWQRIAAALGVRRQTAHRKRRK
jgi:transcriptional regulator of acetoin/glycerol metabolism